MTDGPWSAFGAKQFMDRRTMLKRDTSGAYGRLVKQNVRAWRGMVSRKGEDGKQVLDQCPHAHQKRSVAVKCAEAAAKRLNRAIKEDS